MNASDHPDGLTTNLVKPVGPEVHLSQEVVELLSGCADRVDLTVTVCFAQLRVWSGPLSEAGRHPLREAEWPDQHCLLDTHSYEQVKFTQRADSRAGDRTVTFGESSNSASVAEALCGFQGYGHYLMCPGYFEFHLERSRSEAEKFLEQVDRHFQQEKPDLTILPDFLEDYRLNSEQNWFDTRSWKFAWWVDGLLLGSGDIVPVNLPGWPALARCLRHIVLHADTPPGFTFTRYGELLADRASLRKCVESFIARKGACAFEQLLGIGDAEPLLRALEQQDRLDLGPVGNRSAQLELDFERQSASPVPAKTPDERIHAAC